MRFLTIELALAFARAWPRALRAPPSLVAALATLGHSSVQATPARGRTRDCVRAPSLIGSGRSFPEFAAHQAMADSKNTDWGLHLTGAALVRRLRRTAEGPLETARQVGHVGAVGTPFPLLASSAGDWGVHSGRWSQARIGYSARNALRLSGDPKTRKLRPQPITTRGTSTDQTPRDHARSGREGRKSPPSLVDQGVVHAV